MTLHTAALAGVAFRRTTWFRPERSTLCRDEWDDSRGDIALDADLAVWTVIEIHKRPSRKP